MNSFNKYLSGLLMLCSVSLGLVLIYVIFLFVARDSTTFPFWDQWAFTMEIAKQNGHYSLAQLWQQHSEHRVVLLRLLLLADFHWFSATGRLLLGIILIGQFLHLAIVYRVIFWLDEINIALRLALCGLVSAFFFSPSQLENFVWPFQACFILTSFFASFCFYFFVKSLDASTGLTGSKVRAGLFVCSLISALLATLSAASGLFTWPALIFLCFALRLNWRTLAATAGAGIAVMGSYFMNYQSTSDHASPLMSLRHPLEMVQYVIVYLGGAWAPFGINVAMIVGSVGLLIAVMVLWIAVFRTLWLSRSELFCSAAVVFTLLTGFATASGRINFGVDQAFSSRYQTFAMVFWSALTIWAVSMVAKSATREWIPLFVAVGSLVVVGGPLLKFHVVTGFYDDRASQWRLVEASVLSGVNDRFVMKSISPDQNRTDLALKYLRAHRLSVFAGNRYSQLGSAFSSVYRVNKGLKCEGDTKLFSFIHAVRGSGAQVSGWAWETDSQSEFRNLVLVNEHGKISGFGAGGFVYSGKRPNHIADERIRWFGYVKEEPDTANIQAYGVLQDGRETCPIGAPQVVSRKSFESPLASVRMLSKTQNGVFRRGQWWLDVNGDGLWTKGVDAMNTFGEAGDLPVVGDWDGAGKLRIGVFRGGQWLMDINGNNRWDPGTDWLITFGAPGDIPVVGDWDGSGKVRIGVFRNGQWWLDMNGNGKWDTGKDVVINFGQAGDVPVVGDWDGSGKLRIGVFRNGQWWLDLDGDGKWESDRDEITSFGQRGDRPVIGNWDHAGKLRIGVFRDGHWLLDLNGNRTWDGPDVDQDVIFGQLGDLTSLFQWPTGLSTIP
jgi:hypothetical protein